MNIKSIATLALTMSAFTLANTASAQVITVPLSLPVAPQPVLEKGGERSVVFQLDVSFAYGDTTKKACINVPSNRTLVVEYVSSQAKAWKADPNAPMPLQGFPGEFTLAFTTSSYSTNEHYVPYTQLFRWHPNYTGYIAGQPVKFYSKPSTQFCAIVNKYTSTAQAEVSVNVTAYYLE
jgi:hypothetical protein